MAATAFDPEPPSAAELSDAGPARGAGCREQIHKSMLQRSRLRRGTKWLPAGAVLEGHRPGERHLVHARLRPVADAVREDGVEPVLLVLSERLSTISRIAEVNRLLELALEDVLGDGPARHLAG